MPSWSCKQFVYAFKTELYLQPLHLSQGVNADPEANEVLFSPLSLFEKPIQDPAEVLIARKHAIYEPPANFRKALTIYLTGTPIVDGMHVEKQPDGSVILRTWNLSVSLNIVVNGFEPLPSGKFLPAAFHFMVNTDIVGAAIKRSEKAHNLLLDSNPRLKAKILSINTHDYNVNGLLTIVSTTTLTRASWLPETLRQSFKSSSIVLMYYPISCTTFSSGIKDGLAYQRVEIDCQDFQARIVHGTLQIPANGDNMITSELTGAYAPANEAEKFNFWTPFTTYVLDCLKRTPKNQNHHLILIGDWNSYLDVERDTYREDISTSPTVPATSYLQQLIDTIAQNNFHLHDPIGRKKLRAYDHYTYLSSNGKFRSILDKVFTSFSFDHCDKSISVDWDDYKDMTLSDHRAIITPISLASLCQGWIEYPKTPFTMYPRINLDRRTTQ
jgi:exonuclease III